MIPDSDKIPGRAFIANPVNIERWEEPMEAVLKLQRLQQLKEDLKGLQEEYDIPYARLDLSDLYEDIDRLVDYLRGVFPNRPRTDTTPEAINETS